MGVHTVIGSVKMNELKENEEKMQKFQVKFIDFLQKEAKNPKAYKHFTV